MCALSSGSGLSTLSVLASRASSVRSPDPCPGQPGDHRAGRGGTGTVVTTGRYHLRIEADQPEGTAAWISGRQQGAIAVRLRSAAPDSVPGRRRQVREVVGLVQDGHPASRGHLRHRGAVLQDFQHRPVPLLHDTQLHQHARPLSPRSPADRSKAQDAQTGNQFRSVAQLPEPLSASYRNRVRNLSPRNQNHGVKHLPGSHSVQRLVGENQLASGMAPRPVRGVRISLLI